MRGSRSKAVTISAWVKADRRGTVFIDPWLNGTQRVGPVGNVRANEWEKLVLQTVIPPGANSMRLHISLEQPGSAIISDVRMEY